MKRVQDLHLAFHSQQMTTIYLNVSHIAKCCVLKFDEKGWNQKDQRTPQHVGTCQIYIKNIMIMAKKGNALKSILGNLGQGDKV